MLIYVYMHVYNILRCNERLVKFCYCCFHISFNSISWLHSFLIVKEGFCMLFFIGLMSWIHSCMINQFIYENDFYRLFFVPLWGIKIKQALVCNYWLELFFDMYEVVVGIPSVYRYYSCWLISKFELMNN